MKTRRDFGLAAVLFGFSLLATPAHAQSNPIIVGAIPNLTGIQAALGKAQLAGLEFAVNRINEDGGIAGRQIKIISSDAGDSPTTALNAFNKIVEGGAVAVMGPIFGGQIEALLGPAATAKVPLFTGSGTSTITEHGSPWIFRWTPSDALTKRAWITFARDQIKAKKIGLLCVSVAYGKSGAKFSEDAAKEFGLEIVGTEYYSPADKDMTVQLQKLRSNGAQVILVQGFAPDQTLILQQARRIGVDVPMLISMSTISAGAFDIVKPEDVAGQYSEASSIPQFSTSPELMAWNSEFQKRTGISGDHISLGQYAAMMVLADALKTAGPSATGEPLAQGIKKAKFVGHGLDMQSDTNGNLAHTVTYVQFDNGKKPKAVYTVKE
jgi:branched-chain amino acid transport system substrate-binding protein